VASARSVYSKIEVVLRIIMRSGASSIGDMVSTVLEQQPENFLVRRFDREVEQFVQEVSSAAIRRVVVTCVRLALVAENGALTEAGRRCLRRGQFDAVICERVQFELGAAGVAYDQLNELVKEAFGSWPPRTPTASFLWERLTPDIGLGSFSALLTLLCHAGGAQSYQRKLFLRFGEQQLRDD